MYAGDYNDMFPLAAENPWGASGSLKPWGYVMYHSNYLGTDIMYCPVAPTSEGTGIPRGLLGKMSTSDDWCYYTYGLNYMPNKSKRLILSQTPNASKIVALGDARKIATIQVSMRLNNKANAGTAQGVPYYCHSDAFNAAFLDGSCAAIKPGELTANHKETASGFGNWDCEGIKEGATVTF